MLPPVVTEPVQDDQKFDDSKAVSGKVSIPETDNTAVGRPNNLTLQQSRDLMSALRSGRKAPTAPAKVPVANQTQAAAQAVPSSELNTLKFRGDIATPNGILLISRDEEAAIPLAPEESAAGSLPPATSLDDIPSLPPATGDAFFNMSSYSKKDARKATRQQNGGGRFIEFYDPELERLDVSDYEHATLLVGPSKSDESVPQDASELMSKKLTDIKPTLEYAWGGIEKESLPDEFHSRMDKGTYTVATPPRTVLQWEPTNLWYHPLYFEDVGLERYGHTNKPYIQPFVSTGRFFGQVAMLPYQMTLHPPKAREFALGYYQPGEWAPKKKYQVPFNEEATAVEFLWITGLILLIP